MEYIRNVAKVEINSDKCTGCGLCINVCPHGVIIIDDKVAFLANKDRCIECGACDNNCPVNAIEVETGVGCAYAIIKSWFNSSKTNCC